jgi:hypothetical protein
LLVFADSEINEFEEADARRGSTPGGADGERHHGRGIGRVRDAEGARVERP